MHIATYCYHAYYTYYVENLIYLYGQPNILQAGGSSVILPCVHVNICRVMNSPPLGGPGGLIGLRQGSRRQQHSKYSQHRKYFSL